MKYRNDRQYLKNNFSHKPLQIHCATDMKKAALKLLTNSRWFYGLLFVFIIIQILSLSFFMPAWFDEVYFADISNSLATQNKFLLTIHPLSTHNTEIFFYGPVFFSVQAFIIKYFGLSPFFFRFPVYLCGVASAFILGRTLFLITDKIIFERIFLVLLFTNFLICGSLSCGRMEMMALLFVSLSFFIFFKEYIRDNHGRIIISNILSGIFFGAAILTTPRSCFLYLLLAVPLFEIFLKGIKVKNFKLIIVPALHVFLSFGVPYFLWFYPHLGNATEMINSISPAAKTQFSFSSNHIDINSFAWLLIDLTFLILSLLNKIRVPVYLYGFLISSFVFVLVVIPWSYHHGIMVPFLIIIALLFIFHIQRKSSIRFPSAFLITIFFIQLFFVIIKYMIIWIDLPERNTEALKKIIQKNIPANSRVIGNYNYYYACINNHCLFRSVEDNVDNATGKVVPVEQKVDYLVNTYKGDYIIVQGDEDGMAAPFIKTNKFVKVASIEIPEGYKTFWQSNRERFGLRGSSFYNGSIYKRISP